MIFGDRLVGKPINLECKQVKNSVLEDRMLAEDIWYEAAADAIRHAKRLTELKYIRKLLIVLLNHSAVLM